MIYYNFPFPQNFEHTDFLKRYFVQIQPTSTLQSEHPSPSILFPSSHSSETKKREPSPHFFNNPGAVDIPIPFVFGKLEF